MLLDLALVGCALSSMSVAVMTISTRLPHGRPRDFVLSPGLLVCRLDGIVVELPWFLIMLQIPSSCDVFLYGRFL